MAGGLSILTQDRWEAGLFQGPDPQRIPENGCYDIINGLLDADEGVIYRRGGATYLSSAAGVTPLHLQDGVLAGGPRTVAWNQTGVYQLAADGTSWETVEASIIAATGGRAAILGGLMAIPFYRVSGGSDGLKSGFLLHGGSRLTFGSTYTTGTVAVSSGTPTVTGTGTSWSGNVDAGSMFNATGGKVYPVRSVTSNTALSLGVPYPDATLSGASYTIYNGLALMPTMLAPSVVPKIAAAAGRFFISTGSLIAFSSIGDPATFLGTDVHQTQEGADVTGMMALRDDLLVFTTQGVYRIGNIALDLTDAAGNPQQTLNRISGEVVLWSENGLASWKNAVIVPAVDDVYLMDGASTPVPASAAIRDLYRGYVRSGYQLGDGAVHRGHYVLPVLDDTGAWEDTLVCRLDTGAWSRMTGFSGQSVAFSQRVATTTSRQPSLLSLKSTRVLDCSSWFEPAAGVKNEPDGSTHEWSVTTRDYTIGALRALVKKARVWLEGVDAGTDNPTVTLSYSQGASGSSFTSLGSTSAESVGDSPLPSFTVNAGGKRVRFRVSSTSPFASLKMKALDLMIRPKGRA